MNDIAIKVENLSKQYRLGVRRHDTLRDALGSILSGSKAKIALGVPGQAPNPQDQDTIWALKDISFEVQRGEVVGIIGRNGAGKSTLLKLLSRITEPTYGRAVINGRVGSLLEVGTGFHPELTGRENIFLNGAILGMRRSEIERKFDEIVAFSEIEKFLETPVKRYSSGMYVRLAFAVAAHLEPEILLVDEVLAVGDAAFQKKCLGKMGTVAQEGRTVLFVSHNMGAISELTHRVIYLNSGLLFVDGSPSDAISKYISMENEDIYHVEEISSFDNCGIRVGKVTILGANNNSICNDHPITFQIDIKILNQINNMRFNCICLDSRRKKVFHLQVTNKEINQNIIEPGIYRMFLKLPTLWLSGGVYSVVFKFKELDNPNCDQIIESPSFPVKISGTISKFNTIISPESTWDLEKIGNGI